MSNLTINQLPAANTIDPVNDLLPIFQNASTSTLSISRNTYLGLSSAPVGLTDTQTLTNKTLTSPTLNTPTISSPTLSGTISGTYTIGGTPTFPSSVVTLTGTQTLTNKTLTSPVLNTPTLSSATLVAPTIQNATISADTITGFTTSTSGTIYGMSVTTGVLASAAILNSVNAAAIQTNAVLSAKLGLSSGFTGGVQTQANTGSAGGNMWWINLGGLKIIWGQTATLQGTTTGGANGQVNLPTFLTTVQSAWCNIMGTQNTNNQFVNWGGGYPTTTVGIMNCQSASNTGATMIVGWMIIGT